MKAPIKYPVGIVLALVVVFGTLVLLAGCGGSSSSSPTLRPPTRPPVTPTDPAAPTITKETAKPRIDVVIDDIELGEIGEFDDGDRKKYNPPRMLFNFGFGKTVFPKDIVVIFVLVEKDSGKTMGPFLNEVHQAVKTKADQLLSAAKSDDPTAAGGTWMLIAKAVWEAAQFIYREWSPDEVFEPQRATFSIQSESHRWNGKATSPELTLDFKDHGGHYVLKYDWHLHFG